MEDMYDLIIIGAGTAGCVLAERLTKSGKIRTLLVEAGGPPENRFISIPAGWPYLFRSEVDWAFESEPQTSAGGRRVFVPRGKMLGGSSNMNAQIHQWCHPADFDGWVEAGASGWGWADVQPAFRAQERWLGDDNDPARGRAGPMIISPNKNARPLSHAFVEAARRAGLYAMENYNGHKYQGAWLTELAHKDGKRFSAYDAYLVPAMRRTNLKIITAAHATKVLIEAGRATGVSIRRGDRDETFRSRAVVLSAGAIASPQLLILSGVGPGAMLAKFGIPVRVNRPEVGENLQDHPTSRLVYGTNSTDTFKAAGSRRNKLRYIFFKRGMLASNSAEGFAFTQVHSGPAEAPDLEIVFAPVDVREKTPGHGFSFVTCVVAPRSRGRLVLKSPDPLAPPGIDFGLLSDPGGNDASVLLEGFRLSRKIAAMHPLAAYNTGELAPGADLKTDRDLLAYVHLKLETIYHPTSTCRMGSDERAVVDPKLRVQGVENLWVVDASVMPSVPRGHPNAVVAMIAERASRWIEDAVIR